MSQQTIIFVIITAAVLIAIRWFYKSLKSALRGTGKCAGCPIYDACKNRNSRSCDKNKTR